MLTPGAMNVQDVLQVADANQSVTVAALTKAKKITAKNVVETVTVADVLTKPLKSKVMIQGSVIVVP